MKRVISAVLLVAMILTMCVTACADWTKTWKINPTDGGNWKKGPNHTMPDSGSFWKAKYVSGEWDNSSAYVYKKNEGRATHIEDFNQGKMRTHLNYLENMKTVGKTYWLVGKGKRNTSITYTYNF